MSTYRDFYVDVLNRLGLPTGDNNLDALACVAIIEGENDRYNPLNSVVPSGNSTQFNSVGVQDYKSFDNGVNGTVKLLEGDPWAGVRGALSSDTYESVIHAFANEYANWGAHPDFEAVGQQRAHALLGQSLGSSGPSSSPPPHEFPHGTTYTVQEGDTLSGIAEAHGINDWHTLYNENRDAIGSDPNVIHPGLVLELGQPAKPAPTPHKPAPTPSGHIHYVAAGETLSGIAEAHGISDWHTLYEANRSVVGNDPDMIFPGQRLVIP